MSFHIKIESIHFLRICILTSLLVVPYQVRAQEYFQMRCIGVDVYNEDSMKIAKENVGKIIKISSNVKSSYYNRIKKKDIISVAIFIREEHLKLYLKIWE